MRFSGFGAGEPRCELGFNLVGRVTERRIEWIGPEDSIRDSGIVKGQYARTKERQAHGQGSVAMHGAAGEIRLISRVYAGACKFGLRRTLSGDMTPVDRRCLLHLFPPRRLPGINLHLDSIATV